MGEVILLLLMIPIVICAVVLCMRKRQCNIQQSCSGNTNQSHGEGTEEATTAFNVERTYQSLDNMPVANSSDDVEENYMTSVDQGNHLAQPNDQNGGYAVIRQIRCDCLDDESTNVSIDGAV